MCPYHAGPSFGIENTGEKNEHDSAMYLYVQEEGWARDGT